MAVGVFLWRRQNRNRRVAASMPPHFKQDSDFKPESKHDSPSSSPFAGLLMIGAEIYLPKDPIITIEPDTPDQKLFQVADSLVDSILLDLTSTEPT